MRRQKFFSTDVELRGADQVDLQKSNSTVQYDIEKLTGLDLVDLAPWGSAFRTMEELHGLDGVWAVFELLKEKNKVHILLKPEAEHFLDRIIAAATQEDARLEMITTINFKLRVLGYPIWPNFYTKVMLNLIRQSQIERTTELHQEICKRLQPTSEEILEIFCLFVNDDRKWVQKTLLSLYSASPGIQIYDRVIPALFEKGQLGLARAWRKACIKSLDFPLSSRPREFLSFLARFFPQIELEREELAILNNDHQAADPDSDIPSAQEPSRQDGFMAKWFASSWLPVDFAISMVYQLGTGVIGPRALQALALREQDARGVMDRIGQLERLGIRISPQPYCDVVRHFAAHGNNKLLTDLLNCDIHPTEFNDSAKRQVLLSDALRRQDTNLAHLLREFEAATASDPLPYKLNLLLEAALEPQSPLDKAFMILERMSVTNTTVSEENGLGLLKRAFHGPTRSRPGTEIRFRDLVSKGSRDLDRALGVIRLLSLSDFPVSLWHWTQLLYNLGAIGRMNDLERLCFEFIQLFGRHRKLLVPVFDSTPGQAIGGKQYIPTELPFSHRQHPVQEVFNVPMQRFIVSCGFRAAHSRPQSSLALEECRTEAYDYGVAGGVFILAALRDQGVLIDQKAVETAVIERMPISEPTSTVTKRLIDQAWGYDLLPGAQELGRRIRRKQSGSRWLPPYEPNSSLSRRIWQPTLLAPTEREFLGPMEPHADMFHRTWNH